MREKVVYVTKGLKPPKEFYITYKDVSKHKGTRGCAGCRSLLMKGLPQPHTDTCRDRFAEILKNSKKLQNYEQRKRAYEEDLQKRTERKQERKEERMRDKEELQEYRDNRPKNSTVLGPQWGDPSLVGRDQG